MVVFTFYYTAKFIPKNVWLFPPRFFFIPFIMFALLFSLPASRNAGPGSHTRLFSLLPATVHAFHFYREKTSALSCLVDSRRIAPHTTVVLHSRGAWYSLKSANGARSHELDQKCERHPRTATANA